MDLRSADGIVRTLLRTAQPHVVIDALREVIGTREAIKSVWGSLLFVDVCKTAGRR